MSITTNLELNKHDNPSTNEDEFDVENYLNVNWDKIDEFAGDKNSDILMLKDKDIELANGIEQLKEETSNIRKTLSTVTAIGTNITLEGTSENKVNKIIVQGNTIQDETPTPENKVDIKNVVGDINVKIQNKNLVFAQMKGYNILSDGTFSLDAGYDIHIARIEAGKEYTLNSSPNTFVGGFFYTLPQSSSQSYNSSRVIDTNTTFIAPITGYVAFRSLANYEKPYLEQGSTATDYVEHQEQNLPFTLENGQKLMLGDSLQDDGIHNIKGQIVLDGTETWTDFSYTSGEDNFRVQLSNRVPNILTPPTNPANLKCNYFTAVNRDIAYRKEVVGIAQYGINLGTIFICAPISILSTPNLAGWQTWLSTHNLVVEYDLAEEEIESYNSTQQEQYNAIQNAKTYNKQTNISTSSDELAPILEIQAIGEKAYDDTEIKEDISNIQEEQEEQNNNIEELQQQLQELQEENENLKNALPTITGTGTDITLNKTSKNKFKKFEVGGNTEQIQYEGYNICSSSQIRNNVEIAFYFDKKNIEKIFTLSFITNELLYDNSVYLDKGQGGSVLIGTISGSENTRVSTTITLTDEVYEDLSNSGWYNIRVYKSNGNFNSVTQTQIENGSNLKPFEPYVGGIPSPNPEYPQAIKNVTGNVNVKTQNSFINWNDFNNFANWEPSLSPGYYMFTINNLKPNTKYTLCRTDNAGYNQGMYAGFNVSKNNFNLFIHSTDTTKNLQYISATTESEGKLYITATATNTTRFDLFISIIKDIWVVEGEEYKAKEEQNLPLTLGNIELCKIDIYQDYFYKNNGKWYLHKEIGKTIFDGSNDETWHSESFGTFYRYSTDISNAKIYNASEDFVGYSNYFYKSVKVLTVSTIDLGQFIQYRNSKSFYFASDKNGLNDFKTWLSTHNTEVYYLLATPIDTEITDTTLIEQLEAIKNAMSYYKQTNISGTSTGISPIIDAEAIADMNSLLSGVIE